MNFTEEQLDAINKSGTNIIVSAGAGSGKTAVLTERVLRILKEGTHINELLVLTFTNAAAAEMKKRIGDEILKYPNLVNELDLIDSSYITTFDSFALSIVKKYHYLLNISPNVKIIDESLINIKKNNIIDEILEEYYKNKESKFINLINKFCTKDDDNIKEAIIDISNKLDLIIDKESYIDNYINNYFNEEKINNDLKEYELLILNKVNKINDLLYELSLELDTSYMEKINEALLNLMNSKTYEEVRNNLEIKLPNLPKGTSEYSKKIKKEINDSIIKELKELTSLSIEELKTNYLSTKEYIEIILEIIKELDKKIREFKHNYDVYEFNDIAKLSIKIVSKNENIRKELKETFKEILIDEYQDTSDIQESFINLIENNNVYMVGDIKQSIYRFRNANPYIFKNKYDSYSKNIGGYKIDLNKNFRSREETLNNINLIFNIVMDSVLGGADYKVSHQMVFGNTLYSDNKEKSQNSNFEIYNYEYEKDSGYTKDEIECFITARDIVDKIENKYQIFDKEQSCLRNITYDDIVILMDRATKFDLYKKIFEYLNIPLTKYTDTSITDSNDILILKNIIGLIIKNYKKEYDTEFKYFLTSISRSYLFNLSDDEIFSMLDNNILNNEIIIKIKELCYFYENISISGLIDKIIDEFDIYNKLTEVGNIQDSIIRLEYIYNISKSIENIDYSIEDFYNYLDNLIQEDYSIDVSMNEDSKNTVKIMTIHKSKGLEYPICYYTGVYSSFNISDVKEKFIFNNKYGIITPYFKEGIKKNFLNVIYKNYYIEEEISEKIRLFYVGLTRCREKMIIVCPILDKTMNSLNERYNYRSFLDIINSVYNDIGNYITNIDYSDLLTHDYDLVKKINYKDKINITNKNIEKKAIVIENEIIKSKKYSKEDSKLLNSDIRKNIEFGRKLHYIFEVCDFKKPNYDIIDSKYVEYIKNFLNINIDFKSPKIYKEYEFIDTKDNSHGIIDLMLEYDNEIVIIDYKLKNVNDELYINQLNGYKKYIETKTNKYVKIYLYSIIDNILEEIKG